MTGEIEAAEKALSKARGAVKAAYQRGLKRGMAIARSRLKAPIVEDGPDDTEAATEGTSRSHAEDEELIRRELGHLLPNEVFASKYVVERTGNKVSPGRVGSILKKLTKDGFLVHNGLRGRASRYNRPVVPATPEPVDSEETLL